MTFAAAGSFLFSNSAALTLASAGTGNLLLAEVLTYPGNATVWCTGLSGTGATWVPLGVYFAGTANTQTAAVFAGTVTATGAGTATPAWSGTAPSGYEMDGHEFTSTVGSWALDVQGNLDSAGTNNYVSLTPGSSGELYFGAASFIDSGAVAGSTSGYVYSVNSNSDGTAYNVSCPSGTATYPVWGGAAYAAFGVMVLVKEAAAGTNTSPAYASSYDTTAVPGAGAWANPANAEGGPADGVFATWTP